MKKDQISAIIEANRKIHTDKLKSYVDDYTETCHYVYASDNLYCDKADSFTLADIKKLTAGFEAILEKREKNSITKEVCEV